MKTNVQISISKNVSAFLKIYVPHFSVNAQHWLGRCFMEMRKYRNAYNCFKITLLSICHFSSDDADLANRKYWIDVCLVKLKRPNEARRYLEESLQIKQRVATDPATNNELADVNLWLGISNFACKNVSSAIRNFESSLSIKERSTINGNLDQEIAESLHWIGMCHLCKYAYNKALDYFKKVINIKQFVSFDCSTDTLINAAQLGIAVSLILLGNASDKSTEYLFNAFRNIEEIYLDLLCICKFKELVYACLTRVNKSEKAIEFFEQIKKIEEKLTFDDTGLATI